MGQVYDGGVNPREMELNGDNNDHSEYIYHDVTLMFPYQNMCTIYNIITRFSIWSFTASHTHSLCFFVMLMLRIAPFFHYIARRELGVVMYAPNVMGARGPRKMQVSD